MGEAIISRAGGSSSGGSGGSIIPGACNFILTLKTSKGAPVAGMKVTCNDAGTLYNYSTNSVGKIAVPIKSGWANFSIPNTFENGVRILDQIGGWYNFDAAINTVCKKDAVYNGVTNGTSMSLTKGNYSFWIADKVDLDISGGGGGGGGGAWNNWDSDVLAAGGSGGSGGREATSVEISKSMVSTCYVGSGGSGGDRGFSGGASSGVNGTAGGSGGSSSFLNITVGGGGGGGYGSVSYRGRSSTDGSSGSKGSGTYRGASGGSGGIKSIDGLNGRAGSAGWCKINIWI